MLVLTSYLSFWGGLELLGRSWGGLGRSWDDLGIVLGRSWALLEGSWGGLGRSLGGLGKHFVGRQFLMQFRIHLGGV